MQVGASRDFRLACDKPGLPAGTTLIKACHLVKPSFIALFMPDPMHSKFVTYLYHYLFVK